MSGSYRSPIAHGLMFHRFHAAGEPPSGQGSLTADQFERILLFVGISNILSPAEWMSRLRQQALRPNDLCITFDDGLLNQYMIALPVLRQYGIEAFWFVYSSVFEGGIDRNEVYNYFAMRCFRNFDDYVAEFLSRCGSQIRSELNSAPYREFARELKVKAPFYSDGDLAYRFVRNRLLTRSEFDGIVEDIITAKGLSVTTLAATIWMKDAQLEALCRDGHCIGLHSYDHPFELATLAVSAQRQQFVRNRAHIEKATGQVPKSMSHPLNSYDERTLDVLTELGVQCGFRANMVPPPGKPLNPGPLELARADATNLSNRGGR